jgi:hypothetical protein
VATFYLDAKTTGQKNRQQAYDHQQYAGDHQVSVSACERQSVNNQVLNIYTLCRRNVAARGCG